MKICCMDSDQHIVFAMTGSSISRLCDATASSLDHGCNFEYLGRGRIRRSKLLLNQ